MIKGWVFVVRRWKMNKSIVIVLFLLLAGILGVNRYVFSLLQPVDPSGKNADVLVQIAPNSNTAQVASLLEEQKLIRSAQIFRLYTRYHELDNQLKAGYYLMNGNMSTPEIISLLVRGATASKSFTIPEGYTLKQITDSLADKNFIREELFLELLAKGQFHYAFLKNLPQGSKRLEGYLFPETYNVSLDSTEKDIINVMLAGMDKQLRELKFEEQAKALNLSTRQALTIASMIEREAKKDGDRSLISSVIHNRLRLGMRLQIDATVEYALGGHREKIYYKDLEVDSPYNTYKYNGLPPGPIAAPGRQSLLAAVQPASTNYLYYVAKPDGSHAFATTLEGHNENKRKYLQ
ncbi:endolytic transglycosylase MltG [Desulforamulus ruminis]|uniref:endolytic transglycosylase MltG n=2 Tax=Desulforamulus ruminis TaxID=1564 RepID=UPI0002F4090D|nr:endolytic transglycosylase MltG [Desulforamulus ruminis]